MEFTRAGEVASGDFYFAYRHFQALSNELETPRILACPSDIRPAAAQFKELQNANLSYFVAVTASYHNPDSIVAGDRNLILRDGTAGAVLRLDASNTATWNHRQHGFQGNILAADGHVERVTVGRMREAEERVVGKLTVWLPVVGSSGAEAAIIAKASSDPTPGTPYQTSTPSAPANKVPDSAVAAFQSYFQQPAASTAGRWPSSNPAPAPASPSTPASAPAPASAAAGMARGGPSAPADPVPIAKVEEGVEVASIAKAPAPAHIAVPHSEPAKAPEPVVTPTVPEPAEPESPLLFLARPERSWSAWLFLLALAFALAFLLGFQVRRRHRNRHPTPEA